LSVEANVSEKHTVSVFWAEVAMLGSGGMKKGWREGWGSDPSQLPTVGLMLIHFNHKLHFAKYYEGHQIKEDELGGAC
jgi:hypothetical protein